MDLQNTKIQKRKKVTNRLIGHLPFFLADRVAFRAASDRYDSKDILSRFKALHLIVESSVFLFYKMKKSLWLSTEAYFVDSEVSVAKGLRISMDWIITVFSGDFFEKLVHLPFSKITLIFVKQQMDGCKLSF
jgi:hypothetical protein